MHKQSISRANQYIYVYILLEGAAYFKVTEINNVKRENLVIFFFQNKNETNFHYQ